VLPVGSTAYRPRLFKGCISHPNYKSRLAFNLFPMATAPQILSTNQVVCLDRKSTVVPARPSQPRRCKLCPSDLQMLCCDYIQKGLLYHMPFADHHFFSMVELLKKSLSEALVHFYPLAGRLLTSSDGVVYIDCNDAGADLIEASAPDVGVQDIMGQRSARSFANCFP
jgi:hypothetical protein